MKKNNNDDVGFPHLHGIIVPMITPLKERDELDRPGLERLVEHIIAGGVHGLFILGTSGEAPALSHRLRHELVGHVCKQVNGRVPVLVGITDTSFVEAVQLANHAAECGAPAVVTAPPYYLPVSQPELSDYIEQLVAEMPVPLFLYNMPQTTKVVFAIETIKSLTDLEKIAGIKDSSGDLAYYDDLLKLKSLRPDWSVLIGPEHLMAETVHRGGDGGVNGGGNVYPRLLVDLYAAVKRGDAAREKELQKTLLELNKIFSVGQHASAVIKGMKCACSLLGLCDDRMAEPFMRFNPPERERVRAVLKSHNIRIEPASKA